MFVSVYNFNGVNLFVEHDNACYASKEQNQYQREHSYVKLLNWQYKEQKSEDEYCQVQTNHTSFPLY